MLELHYPMIQFLIMGNIPEHMIRPGVELTPMLYSKVSYKQT